MPKGGLSELFIRIEDFLVRSPEILEILDPFESDMIAAQAHFCSENGNAIAVVVFDHGRQASVERLVKTLGEIGLECFELAALPKSEREHFQRVELPRFTIRVDAADTLATALGELARRASIDELHPKVTDDDWPTGTPAEARAPLELRPRMATHELVEGIDAFPSLGDDDLGQKHRREPHPPPRHPLGSQAISSLEPGAERVLRVRFLRGDRWLPGRVRYISNREARVATAAPPRLGDSVIIGVSFEGEELFVSGIVAAVEKHEGASGTSPGFTVSFGKLAAAKKARLVELLTNARDAGVALRPPPLRYGPRFPVSWPVVVNLDGRPQRATALDISWSGIYLDVEAAIDSELLFALPLDVEAGAIRGRATVVRSVDARRAAEYQTSPGIGVAITHLGPGDDLRYRAFLDRIHLRCQRRVVVGATPRRAQGLARALAAAGYSVTSSTDVDALVELAGREPRPPDIAIIDHSLGNNSRPALMSAFRRRNVPTLTIGEDLSDNARRIIDRLLEVEGGDDE